METEQKGISPANAIPGTRNQRIQPGTNRPSGKRRKKRGKRKRARKITTRVGTNQGEELDASR